MANPTTSGSNFGQSTADKLKDTGEQAANKAKDIASAAADKARGAASAVADAIGGAASSVGSTVGKTAERWTSATGSGVRHLGETIKEKGPQEGVLGGATRTVADTLQESGRYIEQEGLSGMMDDVTELVRRNPLPAVLVGIGIGFLIGRTLGS